MTQEQKTKYLNDIKDFKESDLAACFKVRM